MTLVLAVSFGPHAIAAPTHDDDPRWAHLRVKADPALLDTLQNARDAVLEMIVLGPHAPALDPGPAERGATRAQMDTQAASFFALVDNIAATTHAEIIGRFSAAPAVHLRGDAETALTLAASRGTTSIIEDGPDKLGLIGTAYDDSVTIHNSEGRVMLEAEELWALGYRGAGIRVAIIDTGIDPTHEAFRFADGTSRVAAWADCRTADSACDTTRAPYDDHGHGTHVAGTAVGSSLYDGGDGVFSETGIAPEATLVVARFLDGSGKGSYADAIKSLEWSFDQGVDITTNSWGGSCTSSADAVVRTIDRLGAAGMLSVAAAGNSGPWSSTVSAPACAEYALSVGAVDDTYQIASFSSRGPCTDLTSGNGPRICPDLVAKGVAVRSALPRSGATRADPSGYGTWSGTSMAAPHVSGAAALIEQMKRNETGTGWDTTAQAEKWILGSTALDLGPTGPDDAYGAGHPRLSLVRDVILHNDTADIVPDIIVTHPHLRTRESTGLSFSVKNLGGATAQGRLVTTLTHADGRVEVLFDETTTLSLLDRRTATHTFIAGADAAPGNYTFHGTYDHTWQDSEGTIHTAVAEASATFRIERAFIVTTMSTATRADLLERQEVQVTLTNVGDLAAEPLDVSFLIPTAYIVVPPSSYDPIADNRYADPPPDTVQDRPYADGTRLIYALDDLPAGTSFSFRVAVVPKDLGTHTFHATATFSDLSLAEVTYAAQQDQTVVLPVP